MNRPILTVVGVLILFCFHIKSQSKKAAAVESPTLLTAGASPLFSPSDSLRTDDIELLIAPLEEAQLLSGAILIASGKDIVYERTFGFSNWELQVPNTPATRFGIASITKIMTEALTRFLVKEGRIDLEAPVEQYIPGFPRGPEGGMPTVGHLLNHRAGVPHRVTDPIDETQPLSAAEIVERVKKQGLLFEPGSRRLYSSAGYTCLARVIEIVEKEPFASVLSKRVFLPAGMKSAADETGQNLMPGRALPYRLGAEGGRVVVKNAPSKDLRFLTGAGSVYASVRDLFRFVQSTLDDVFDAELRDEVVGENQETWISLTGRTGGYEASVDFIPSQRLVFVFLSNLRSAANWQLRERIQNLLSGKPVMKIPPPPVVAKAFEHPQSIVGSYGPAEITIIDGQLFRGDGEFYPIEGRRYYIPASGTIMYFRRDSNGDVDALVSVSGGGRKNVLERSKPSE